MGQLIQKVQLRQDLKLNPQMLQSMEILQMNSDELLEYLNKVRQENPLIEHDDVPVFQKEYEQLRKKNSWIDAGMTSTSFSDMPEKGVLDSQTESLNSFLHDQLERKNLPSRLLTLCRYLADLLDDNGWISQDDLDHLLSLNVPQSMLSEALEQIQSLDPVGVGARDLSECLLLQLRQIKNPPVGTEEIIASYLTQLSRGHCRQIAKELGITVDQVHAAETLISGLDPHPGRAFQATEAITYIRPDIFVVELDGQLSVVMNEFYLPKVTISDYYLRLLKQSNDEDTKEYLHQKMQQAKWLLNGLERRGSTLRACAQAILDTQYDFFSGATNELVPMSLASVANAVSVHTSTVCRAIRGKYLQCHQGTYPLRYFFNRQVSEDGSSQQAVKQKILQLIRDESPAKPLSDQQLCRILDSQGIQVARRTVAKYRIQLGIPSSTARKR